MRVRSPAALHGGEGGGEIMSGAGGEAGVDADRGVEIGVDRAQDRGHRPAGRHPGHVHLAVDDTVLLDDLARDAGDYSWLALPTLLVRSLEPVPALLHIGVLRLRRIGDEESVRLGELVHTRSGREVV